MRNILAIGLFFFCGVGVVSAEPLIVYKYTTDTGYASSLYDTLAQCNSARGTEAYNYPSLVFGQCIAVNIEAPSDPCAYGPGYDADYCAGLTNPLPASGGSSGTGVGGSGTGSGLFTTPAPAGFTGPPEPIVVTDFKSFIDYVVQSLIAPFFSIFLGAAVVFFLWNITMVIKNSDQPEELAKFKSKAVWGIVAIAVMVSMWGLVAFVTSSLNLNNTPDIRIKGL